MPNTALETAIKEAYANAPSDQVIMHTLEIRHDDFVDDYGNPTAIRVVRDFQDFTATLESTAPLNAGEEVTFVRFAFDFSLPEINDGGAPELVLTMDNVGQTLMSSLDLAVVSDSPISITYRPYLSTDTSAPQMNPPLTLTLSDINADVFQVTARAHFPEIVNAAFPRDLYELADFPSLG